MTQRQSRAAMPHPHAPTHLRVNDLVNPVGTPGRPYFGWIVNDSRPNQVQTRYQILVASSPAHLADRTGGVWDSGEVASSRQNHVVYNGEIRLRSNTRYFWTVRTWDREGQTSPYAEPGAFTVGLLANDDWAGAQWIKGDANDPDGVTYYRKSVTLPPGRIRRATLFITAVHKYEVAINGRLIGKGPSYHYPQYQYYNAYDVAGYLTPGASNVFAVLTHWFGGGQGRPASARGLLMKALVEYADGRHVIVATDQSWKQRRAACWIAGQPQRNDEGVGTVEKIDGRSVLPEWQAPFYDDGSWPAAIEIGPQPTPPWTGDLYPDLSRIVERTISPAAITDLGGGQYVVDLGKVYAGRPQITFAGGAPSTVIAMEGGYTLSADGTIDRAHNQDTDMRYVAIANGGDFTFLPQEYLGMRYFQVDNAPTAITAENFVFITRHAVLEGDRSTFTSSHLTLNQVWDMMKHSLFLGAQEQFLDTPTREKGGFLLDSMNESLAAIAAFGERVLTRKTLQEFLHSMDHYWSGEGDRGRMNAVYPNGDGARDIPDFTQAYLVWVWEYYLHSGDRQFLSDNYARLKSIADYVDRHQDGATGLIHRLTGGGLGAYQYGIVDWPPAMRYGYDMAAVARTVINAYAYADYDIVARIAAELGKTADKEAYRALAEAMKVAINRRLINAQGVYVDGLNDDSRQSAHVSQQANAFPLALGIAPADKQASVLE
ncbi:MAG TPA: family 78 glycoside hydrolase catalytic domain, partial [Anaerolineae bacterium]